MLSEKAKVIGDQPAFPLPTGDSIGGMSYRQWLVGQALAATAGMIDTDPFNRARRIAEVVADANDVADAALERQAAE